MTPFQPVGPFFHVWLRDEPRGFASLVSEGTLGPRIVVEGTLIDGGGSPVTDGLVEIWQADAAGRYRHPHDPESSSADPAFAGYGRAATDDAGRFRFETVKPGPRSGQAQHVLVRVFAPGILTPYWTRMYFEDENANRTDAVLQLVPVDRRPTLLARREGEQQYRFDIVLQGERETVFFEA